MFGNRKGKKESRQLSAKFGRELSHFLQPLLSELDRKMDKRLVRTFQQLVCVIISFRHANYGLLLTELGSYLLGAEQAPAGTKRISNLLRSKRWAYKLIERFLWWRGEEELERLEESKQRVLCLWDESVIEKAESIALEGLCAVRSSVARRLKRIKPGYYNPPSGRPVFVPGMNWLMVMIGGFDAPPVVTAMKWWSTRGPLQQTKREVEKALLLQLAKAWGQRLLHVWDRGFAGQPWLEAALEQKVCFLLRWPKRYKLVDTNGRHLKAWQLTRGKRSLDHRLIWDTKRRCQRKTGIYFLQVHHPSFPQIPLWLVVSRPGQGRSPWYLLTSEPVTSTAAAWRLVFAYARRWQIEMGFRFLKTELAIESPRLWSWDNRLKLLLIVTLAFAFLISLLHFLATDALAAFFRRWCHRTGKRYREASVPLYRLRSALSRLWLAHPPPLSLSFLHFSG